MRTLQLVWLLTALATPASAKVNSRTFRQEKALADLICSHHLLFETNVRSRIECGVMCLNEKPCVSLTYTLGICRGYTSGSPEKTEAALANGTLTFVTDTFQCAKCGNVAALKPTVQSSRYDSAYASRAVDINFDDDYYHHSCSHTNNTSGVRQWWQVDLEKSYDIFSVIITNRVIKPERLRDFDIDVYNVDPRTNPGATSTLCYHQIGQMGNGTKELSCYYSPVTGVFVRITNAPSHYLTLCEVQVMAIPSN